jgi:hypothetical protein
MTQRASTSGFTLLDTDGIDIDTITGIHGLSIDLADNTTAGFYAAGSRYYIVISSVTIDAQTVNFVLATFDIGYPEAVLNTTIATLTSQTSFTLTDGPAENDALNGMWLVIHDVASKVQWGKAIVDDYVGSTKTVTLVAGTTFTVAASDNVAVMGPAPLQPVTAGRTLEVDASGLADVDVRQWLGTAAATPTVAGVPEVDVTHWIGTAAATPTVAGVPEVDVTHFGGTAGTFASGRPEVNTSHVAGTAQTAGDIIADTNDIQARLPAALVSGRMDSSVGAMAANVITASAINDNAITAAKVAADVSAEIADAVLDEDMTAHQTQGTLGQAIGDPVADADTIWGLVNTNLDATISSRASSAALSTVQADTDDIQARLPAALVGGRMDSSVGAYAAGQVPIRPSASGTADAGSSSTTIVDAERTEADTNYWRNCIVRFTSGTLNGQTALVTAFDPATDTITFAPATTVAVAAGHTYELLPMSRVDLQLVLGAVINALVNGRVDVDLGAWKGAVPANLTVGDYVPAHLRGTDTDVITAASIAPGAIGASEAPNLDVAVSTRLAPTVAGRTLDVTATGEAGLDLDNTVGTLAKGTEITGFNDLDAAGVRSAVGLAAANLDTQLTTIDDFLDTEIAAILAAVDTEVAAIKAKTDNLPEGITKNAVLNNFEFLMVDSADHVTGKTGLTVTAERSIDGGAFAACANSVTEVANGVYKINLAATDTNGDVITYKFTGTGADATIITIKTEA